MSKFEVLDKPDDARKIDRGDMLGFCERMPEFCRDALQRAERVQIAYTQPRNIVIAGMGGSAIGGELLRDWLNDKASIPIAVCRDYVLPTYVDEKSLLIAVSYSGETEETLSALLHAVKRHCMIVTVSSGGHLRAFSQKLEIPHIQIPEGFAPRAAIAYLFFPLVTVMEKIGVNKETDEVEESLQILQKTSRENALTTPFEKNLAKKLASEIEGTIPIVYGFRQYSAVARRLKCQFNENSKVPSKFDMFSELNHNEVVGWEASNNLTKNFSIVFLRDPEEPLEIKQRIQVTKQIASPKVSKILEIHALGKKKLAKMLSAQYIGDFASVYLALLQGVDPSPTKTISYLKQEMKKKHDVISKLEEEVKRVK